MLQFLFGYPHKTVDNLLFSAPIYIYFIYSFFIPNSCNNNKIETIFKEYMLQYIFLLAPNYNYLLYKQIELTNNLKTNSSNKKMWIKHIKLTTYLLLLKHILNLLKEFVV